MLLKKEIIYRKYIRVYKSGLFNKTLKMKKSYIYTYFKYKRNNQSTYTVFKGWLFFGITLGSLRALINEDLPRHHYKYTISFYRIVSSLLKLLSYKKSILVVNRFNKDLFLILDQIAPYLESIIFNNPKSFIKYKNKKKKSIKKKISKKIFIKI